MAFEQAAIKIEKQQEFSKLQGTVEQAFSPEKVERFLKQVDRKGIRIREFDAVLSARLLEEVGSGPAAGKNIEWRRRDASAAGCLRPAPSRRAPGEWRRR